MSTELPGGARGSPGVKVEHFFSMADYTAPTPPLTPHHSLGTLRISLPGKPNFHPIYNHPFLGHCLSVYSSASH